ncbi:MAG: methylglyoxal synthase [Clostridium sp.]|uniref:methylglyoxal synthase n=1 Tax=Clostridium sp. TaxID=1506 RepID=UPI003EE5589E
MKVALIAHDRKKSEMIEFAKKYEGVLSKLDLVATGTTGGLVMENTNLKIKRYKSGPFGGDQQIGALIPEGEIDMIIFFRDPLTAQPHEPDISALLRLCDVYKLPVATNSETGKMLIEGIAFENSKLI